MHDDMENETPRPADETPTLASVDVVPGTVALCGAVLIALDWWDLGHGTLGAVGGAAWCAAIGWVLGRSGRGDRSEDSADRITIRRIIVRTFGPVGVSLLLALSVARYGEGGAAPNEWFDGWPDGGLLGHLWLPVAAAALFVASSLAEPHLPSLRLSGVLVSRRRVATSLTVAAMATGIGLVVAAGGPGRSPWGAAALTVVGFGVGVVLAVVLPSSGGSRARHPWLTPLASLALPRRRDAPDRGGAVIWASYAAVWPLLCAFGDRSSSGSAVRWMILVVVGIALAQVAVIVTISGRRIVRDLRPGRRRSIVAGMAATAILIGASTVSVAHGGRGAFALFRNPRAGLDLAVPVIEVPVPRPLSVLLVGDSTMAPLRWFRQGTVALRGFDFVLDVESCRRVAERSCWGRESRIPTSAARAILDSKRQFDYVVLMAGVHSYKSELAGEIRTVQQAAEKAGAKLLILNLRESQRYSNEGADKNTSVLAEFNAIIESVATKLGPDKVTVLDWNGFSYMERNWFRSDGIHPNIVGTVALGWFISQAVAAEAGNPCPFDWSYPCREPTQADAKRRWLIEFGVIATNEHCYQDGNERTPVCERDRRM